MALSFTHAKVLAGSDDGNPAHAQSDDWNADHALASSVGGVLANLTGASGPVTENGVAALKAWLGVPPQGKYISGYGYAPLAMTSASGNINGVGEMEFMPIPIFANSVSIKSLMLRLQTGVSGSTCQLALYDDLNGMPNNLLGHTNDLSTSGSFTTLIGDMLATATLTDMSMAWIAANFTTPGSTHQQVVQMNGGANMFAWSGYQTPGNALAENQFGWRISQTYGTWPAQVAGTLGALGVTVPLMGFVVA